MTSSPHGSPGSRRAELIATLRRLEAEQIAEERESLSASLSAFTEAAWPVIHPGRRYVHNWHIDALAEHLEAVTWGEILRLLINIPFRSMKSTLVSVIWPAWQWSFMPRHQWLGISYAAKLSVRDNVRMRRLVTSPWYQARWGGTVQLTGDQNAKERFENDRGGHRIAVGMDGGLMGDGGDTIIMDDPHDRKKAHSEVERENALVTYDEAIVSRLNDPDTSAIVLIMQRLHELDLSGHVLEEGGWDHVMIPMRYEPARAYCTSLRGAEYQRDPRTEPGELMWPERFPERAVARLERVLGPYGTSGQLQQRPAPEGGGILRRAWWQRYTKPEIPVFEFVLAVVDSALTRDETNAASACTVWGVYRDSDMRHKVLLVHAWRDWLEFNELVERIALTRYQYRCHRVIVEAKANGLNVVQELNRRAGGEPMMQEGDQREGLSIIAMAPPPGDKVSRAYAVQGILASGHVMAPYNLALGAWNSWAELVIAECESFPAGRLKDLVDTVTQGLAYLRTTGIALFDHELPDPREALYEVRRQAGADRNGEAIY